MKLNHALTRICIVQLWWDCCLPRTKLHHSLHFVVIKNNIVTTANISTIHLDHGGFSNQILCHLAITYMKGNSH